MVHTNESKMCFGIIGSEIKDRIEQHGLTIDEVWNAIKAQFGVGSRTQLTDRDWLLLSVKLQDVRADSKAFNLFIENVKRLKENNYDFESTEFKTK